MNKVALLVIALAACKGTDKDNAGGKAGGTGGKGGCATNAKTPADLVTSKSPSNMLAPFEKLSLGMTRDEVAAVCPNFFDDADSAKRKGSFSVNEIVGEFGDKQFAQASFWFVDDKLDSIAYSLPPTIEAALTAQWGAPKVSSGAKPAHAWFDEGKQIRAILEPVGFNDSRSLTISRYMPLAAFIEPETTRIAWKPQDVLGKMPADLEKTFAQYKDKVETSAAVKAKTDEMMKDLNKEVEAMGIDTKRNTNLPDFELPASPFSSERGTRVVLYANDDGSIRGYSLAFRTKNLTPEFSWPAQSAEIAKLLDASWGPSKTVKETLGDEKHWYDAKRGVRATARIDDADEIDLGFSRYTPLATIWGAPNGPWGFEKAERPLIGATPEEIKAAYKDYEIKHDDKANTVTLYFPPTDYDGATSRMHVLAFVRDGKVASFRFNLPYDSNPAAQGEYAAALEAKLGKPGKEKYGEVPYGKKTKARWSDITKSLDVMVEK